LVWLHCTQFTAFCLEDWAEIGVGFGEFAEDGSVKAIEFAVGEGLEPALAAAEGLGRRVAFEELAVELEDEQGAGVGLDGPEGAEDVGDAVAEEGADESDVFGCNGLVSGEGGFATGEGDQAVVLEVDRS
jgi:hypothetical protein